MARLLAVLAVLAVLLALLAVLPVAAAAERQAAGPPAALVPGALVPGGTAEATEIVDGDTLILADGRQVRLVGLQAPKLPLGRDGFAAWPLAEESRAALAGLVQGRRLSLSYGGRQTDRHGRLLAHLHDEAGLWIQGEMLRQGMARVYSFADNRALVAEMLAAEREARAARRGIWALRFYAVRPADAVDVDIGTFQIVEGRVVAAARVRGRIFLNFGPDRRTDFTVTIAPSDRRQFDAAGLEPEKWEGRHVRVRGWVDRHNGPSISASHPEQIELLER